MFGPRRQRGKAESDRRIRTRLRCPFKQAGSGDCNLDESVGPKIAHRLSNSLIRAA
jgi:hypothetical protein